MRGLRAAPTIVIYPNLNLASSTLLNLSLAGIPTLLQPPPPSSLLPFSGSSVGRLDYNGLLLLPHHPFLLFERSFVRGGVCKSRGRRGSVEYPFPLPEPLILGFYLSFPGCWLCHLGFYPSVKLSGTNPCMHDAP